MALTWTDRIVVCQECRREFRVSEEALNHTPLEDIAFCLECVVGEPVSGEKLNGSRV